MDDNILESILAHDSETRTVDYKRAIPWIQGDREKLIKDFLAMANAGGGFIVIGVDESHAEEHLRFAGVPTEMLDSWDTTNVSVDVNNYCAPPLDLDLRKYKSNKFGQTFVFLRVPRHGKTPHICIRDYCNQKEPILQKGALYFRTKNKQSASISDPSDWDALLNRCMLTRSDELRMIFEQVLRGVQSQQTPKPRSNFDPFQEMDRLLRVSKEFQSIDEKADVVFWEVFAHPRVMLPAGSKQEILKALDGAMIDHRGWPFLFCFQNSRWDYKTSNSGMFAVSTTPFVKEIAFQYWVFDYELQQFYSRNLTDESALGQPKVFAPRFQVCLNAEAVEAVGKLFQGLEYPLDTEISLAIRYSPAKALRSGSAYDHDWQTPTSDPFADTVLTVTGTYNLLELVNGPSSISAGMTARLLEKLNCRRPLSIEYLRKKAEEHLVKVMNIPQGMRPVS